MNQRVLGVHTATDHWPSNSTATIKDSLGISTSIGQSRPTQDALRDTDRVLWALAE